MNERIHLHLHVPLNPNKNSCNLFHDISNSDQEEEINIDKNILEMFEKLYNLSNKFCNERNKTYIRLILLNRKVYR